MAALTAVGPLGILGDRGGGAFGSGRSMNQRRRRKARSLVVADPKSAVMTVITPTEATQMMMARLASG
jgi:hypothetical protein